MSPRPEVANSRVLLLRGVNVGGHGRLPMAELRELLTDLGCNEAATYLQSGNAVVRGGPPDLAGRLSERLGIAVFERSAADLSAVIEANPFSHVEDPTKLVVVFLDQQPEPAAYADLDPATFAPDELALGDGVLYVHYPQGQGQATLKPSVFTRLGVVATARNWRTVLALAQMSGNDEQDELSPCVASAHPAGRPRADRPESPQPPAATRRGCS